MAPFRCLPVEFLDDVDKPIPARWDELERHRQAIEAGNHGIGIIFPGAGASWFREMREESAS